MLLLVIDKKDEEYGQTVRAAGVHVTLYYEGNGMDLPKTFGELAIWSLMQFPVLAVAAGIAWWVNREARRQYTLLFGDRKSVV